MPLVLASCATSYQPNNGQPSKQAKKSATKPQPKPAAIDSVVEAPVAVTKLINQAEQQVNTGNEQAAATSLERAIRIAPRFPDSYYHLAEIRYRQGRYSLAKSFAQKSISLGAKGWVRWQAERLVDKASE